MEPVKQEDSLGCAVACTAFILRKSYAQSLSLFENGFRKANTTGILCKEIVTALNLAGLKFEYKHIKGKNRIYRANTIVFLRRSKKYTNGHYLVRASKNKWMDPWLNFPNEEIEAGYRTRLPEKPIYAIFPKERVGS